MKLVVRHAGRERNAEVVPTDHGYRIELDGVVHEVDVAGGGERDVVVKSLLLEGVQHETLVEPLGRGRYRVSTAGGGEEIEILDPLALLAEQAHGAGGGGPKQVTAYMPGVVKRVLVTEGDTVERGQSLAVLEAMKMENEIEAETDGTVRKILVEAGQAVDGGEALFEIE